MKGTRVHSDLPGDRQANQSLSTVFDNFYADLGKIKEYNESYNLTEEEAQMHEDQQTQFEKKIGEGWEYIDKHFTAEENKGKCVDMVPLFQEFKNLKKIGKANYFPALDYIQYLQNFERNEKIPFHLKDKKYLQYLRHAAAYLVDFIKRTQPLTDFTKLEYSISEQFEKEWEEGSLYGWGDIIAHFKFKP